MELLLLELLILLLVRRKGVGVTVLRHGLEVARELLGLCELLVACYHFIIRTLSPIRFILKFTIGVADLIDLLLLWLSHAIRLCKVLPVSDVRYRL